MLFQLFPGVYAVGRPQITQNGLWMAGVLCAGEGAALGYRSAAAHWGILRPGLTVEVIRGRSRGRCRARINVDGAETSIPLRARRSRSLPERDIAIREGIPVTSVARTLLNLASGLSPSALERAFLEADRLGVLVDEDLIDCASRANGHRGAIKFKQMIMRRIPDLGDLRSVLEAMFVTLCRDEGIERPETNVLVGTYEVDCIWRSRRLIVELDGYEFHRGLEMFERDAERSNQLRSDGWTVLRFTWRMLTAQPSLVADQVKDVLAGATPAKVETIATL